MARKKKLPAAPAAPAKARGKVAQVSELKAGLSAYLAQVKRGEEVLVTERGTAIAKLVPVRRDRPQGVDEAEWARLLEMERRGLVRIGTGKLPDGFFDRPRPKVPDGWLEEWLEWERGEGAR